MNSITPRASPQLPENNGISKVVEETRNFATLPAAEPLTTERYLSAKHIAPDSSSEMNLGPVKGRLSQLGLRREVSIKVADFHHVPAILAQTDVIFTSAAPYVQDLTRQSGGRLVAREAPAVLKKMDLYGW